MAMTEAEHQRNRAKCQALMDEMTDCDRCGRKDCKKEDAWKCIRYFLFGEDRPEYQEGENG